jgi:hypothetical protein
MAATTRADAIWTASLSLVTWGSSVHSAKWLAGSGAGGTDHHCRTSGVPDFGAFSVGALAAPTRR